MKVTVISIVISKPGEDLKELVKKMEEWDIRGQVDSNQTTALIRSTRILKRVLETCGDLQSLI